MMSIEIRKNFDFVPAGIESNETIYFTVPNGRISVMFDSDGGLSIIGVNEKSMTSRLVIMPRSGNAINVSLE